MESTPAVSSSPEILKSSRIISAISDKTIIKSPRASLTRRQQSVWDLLQSETAYRKVLDVLVEQCLHPLLAIQRQCSGVDGKSPIRGARRSASAVELRKAIGTAKTHQQVKSGRHRTIGGVVKKSKSLLSLSDLQTIFRNVDHLHRLSKSLEVSLYKRGVNGNVGETMLKRSAYLKMYVSYFMGAEKGMQLVHELQLTDQRFKSFLDTVDLKRVGGCLNSLLIRPVQRLPMYCLLLRDIIKHTPTDHPDSQNLKAALGKIGECVDYCEKLLKQHDAKPTPTKDTRQMSGDADEALLKQQSQFISSKVTPHHDWSTFAAF